MDARLIAVAACGVAVYVTGVVLTARGRPYGVALQTVHKLLAVAILVIIGLMAYRARQADGLEPDTWIALVAGAVLWIASIATGGVVSARSQPNAVQLRLHRVVPWVAGIALAYGVWLLAVPR